MKRFAVKLIAVVAIAAAAIQVSAANDKNAILFSWDGVQREHLKQCLSRNELPNLAALIKEGKLVDIEVTHVTDTKAGHSQMLTGYDPETTGVYSNSKFKPIPAGYSIFERLESTLGKDKIVTVMLTGKTHHIGNCGPKVKIDPKTLDPGYFPGKDNDAKTTDAAATKATDAAPETAPLTPKERRKAAKKAAAAEPKTTDGAAATSTEKPADTAPLKPGAKRRAANQATAQNKATNAAGQNKLGEPWYLVYKNMDVWNGEKQRNAPEVGPLALGYLDKYSKDRFFMFFHFSDPDHQGHKFGENSKEENDAYILCDEWLGTVVKKLKDLGIYDKTLVYVNSDHGFDEDKKSHKKAPTVFLATNDKNIARDGNQRDIVPTILTEMGVDSSKFEPKYTGKSLTEK